MRAPPADRRPPCRAAAAAAVSTQVRGDAQGLQGLLSDSVDADVPAVR